MDEVDQIAYEDHITSYLSFTNTSNIGAARAALERLDWNLEAAVEAYFDSTSRISSTTPPRVPNQSSVLSSAYERLSVDGPINSASHNSRTRYPPRSYQAAPPPRPMPKLLNFIFKLWIGPFRFLAVPVSFVADVGLTVFGILGELLGLRLPSISFHWPRSSYFGWKNPSVTASPRVSAERWVRELEEELRARSSYSSSQPGSPGMKRLPDFLLMGYDEAVRKAKDELKVLMVILLSEEHDDASHFKREVLTDETLLQALQSNEILVWGGDVRDRDASLAGTILDASTYPFVAFVSLKAKRPASTTSSISASTNRSTTNVMTVCTRLEGSPHDTTSSASIINVINTIVLPRTSSFLGRLKKEKSRREADRRLREEQDKAYAEAGRLDRERVMKKMAELEAESKRIEELRLKDLENERKKKERIDLEEQKQRWRYWARKERLRQEPEKGTTIGFRLGNGKRVIRKFLADDSLESLYLFVEVESGKGIRSTNDREEDEKDDGTKDLPRPREDYQHQYGFKLSTAMPRRTIPEKGMRINEFGGLDGANVNVEGNFFSVGSGSSIKSSSSEEDEEEDEE
ncbi:hypothetical protein BY996DRAFT_4598462 [Phakopsora pachyrhizi]|nr:hypothetical protein BY996DRAFT_4598462 [Phakopsora pachyrhizi]